MPEQLEPPTNPVDPAEMWKADPNVLRAQTGVGAAEQLGGSALGLAAPESRQPAWVTQEMMDAAAEAKATQGLGNKTYDEELTRLYGDPDTATTASAASVGGSEKGRVLSGYEAKARQAKTLAALREQRVADGRAPFEMPH